MINKTIKEIINLYETIKDRHKAGVEIKKSGLLDRLEKEIRQEYPDIKIKNRIKPRDVIHAYETGESLICFECKRVKTYIPRSNRLVCERTCRRTLENLRKTYKEKYKEDPLIDKKLYEKNSRLTFEEIVDRCYEIYLHNLNKNRAQSLIRREGLLKLAREKSGFPDLTVNTIIESKRLNQPLFCPSCGKPRKYEKRTDSLVCSRNCKTTSEKRKLTVMKKYSVENISQLEQIKKKREQTFLEKYGGNPLSNPEIRKKLIKTNIERYGVDNPMKNREIATKLSCSLKKTYEKRGEEIVQKIRETCLERYGVEHHFQNENIWNRLKETLKERYGFEFPRQIVMSPEMKKFINDRDYAKKIVEKYRYVTRIAYHLNTSHSTVRKYAEEHGIHELLQDGTYRSYGEDEICEFIKSFYDGEIQRNVRNVITPYEIDVYIPEKKLGIEFHGTVMHSDLFKNDRKYHLKKYQKAKENGISLIQIFEYEWLTKEKICKSIIKHRMGIIDNKIAARKCRVIRLDSGTYKRFLEENHLKGYVYAPYRYGLVFEDELVSVAGFIEPRKGVGKRKNEKAYELVRICSKHDMLVMGGVGKMLNAFIRDMKDSPVDFIYTFTDNRYFTGSSMMALGFEKERETAPNYHYIDLVTNRVVHRYSLRKDILVQKYGRKIEGAENMTERTLAEMLGYYRLWDAGHTRWIKKWN